MDKVFSKAVSEIRKAKTFAICGHINPDGDSIGSMLSLGLGLKRLKKQVQMISLDALPERFKVLPGSELIISRVKNRPDIAIAVDCGSKEILGMDLADFKRSRFSLEIDHHRFRDQFADLALVYPQAASVGEVIFRILERLKVSIDKDIAKNLLTSIIVETNSFRLPGVRPETFSLCAKLVSTGIDFYKLVNEVYWSQTKESLLLTGLVLSRCRFLKNGRLVWSYVSLSDFKRFKGKLEDVDPVANQMRTIKDVEAVALFRQTAKGVLRVSLRSKGAINVAEVAREFSGGGHYDLAGCFIADTRFERRKLLKLLSDLIK